MANTSNKTLAIDFGTSNSAVAVCENSAVKRLQMEPDSDTLPTAVFFDFAKNQVLVGTEANKHLLAGSEGRYMRSLKRVLGTSLMREKRFMMGQRRDFFDIIANFLSELKTRAERTEGCKFTRVLSGRPVRFHDNADKDRQAEADLRECYLRAGFSEVEFMYEPEAATLANNILNTEAAVGLIVDIGGGTSDYTVFTSNRMDNSVEILSSHGERFGGTDFDKAVNVNYFMPLLGKDTPLRRVFGEGTASAPISLFNDLATWEKIPFLYSPETLRNAHEWERLALDRQPFARLVEVLNYELGHELSMQAEDAKILVNGSGVAQNIGLGLIGENAQVEIARTDMNDLLIGHQTKMITGILETISMADRSPEDITDVVFVGGSSLMAFITEALRASFPQAKFHTSAVFTAVVDGLAIAAAKP